MRLIAVAVLVVGAGILGFVLGTREAPVQRTTGENPPPHEEPPPVPRPEPKPEDKPPPPQEDPRRPDGPGDRERRMQAGLETYLESLRIPGAIAAQAKELGVPDRILRMAFGAEWWLHAWRQFPGPVEKEGVRAALATLATEGEHGFLAVLALIRGSGYGEHYPAMVRATWQPGFERRLMETIDEYIPRGGTVAKAYGALGAVDTDEVRRYLRAALKQHEYHAMNFTGVATALAELGDLEAVPAVAAALDKGSWSGVRPALLTALGDMGGDEAKRALLAYLRKPKVGLQSYAVRALSKIDPALARVEAEALVDKVSAIERQRLRTFLAGSD